jgi:hypothetical protein
MPVDGEMSDNDWSHEETDEPLLDDRRNFYKVEKWSRDGLHIEGTLFTRRSVGAKKPWAGN